MSKVTFGYSATSGFRIQIAYRFEDDHLVVESIIQVDPEHRDRGVNILPQFIGYDENSRELVLSKENGFSFELLHRDEHHELSKLWLMNPLRDMEAKGMPELALATLMGRRHQALQRLPNAENLAEVHPDVQPGVQQQIVESRVSRELTSHANSRPLMNTKLAHDILKLLQTYTKSRFFRRDQVPNKKYLFTQIHFPSHPKLSDLEAKFVVQGKHYDILSIFALHRWFPTRRYLLPRSLTVLTQQYPELQKPRVLQLWAGNYIDWLKRGYKIGGKVKAEKVTTALSNAQSLFTASTLEGATKEELIKILTFTKPPDNSTKFSVPASLLDAIGTMRTHRWYVGQKSFGFQKLFEDFPTLKDDKEYLRLLVWIHQYCLSLERVTFNKKEEKIKNIVDALERAKTKAGHDPSYRTSLTKFLTFGGNASLLSAIKEQRNPTDAGNSHGYNMLCDDFNELKLEKWVKDYIERLNRKPFISAEKRKARNEKVARLRGALQRAYEYSESFELKDLLTIRVNEQESLVDAIKSRRTVTDAPTAGLKRLCKDFKLNPEDFSSPPTSPTTGFRHD